MARQFVWCYCRSGFVVVGLCLAAGVAECLSVFPYSMSFFNLAVGGPKQGRFHLLDSNIDWGQDVLELRNWALTHPEAQPLFVRIAGPFSVELLDIDAQSISQSLRIEIPDEAYEIVHPILPGWYAVSVNDLMGYGRPLQRRDLVMDQLRRLKPTTTIGYSIHIYHVAP